ncbi:MAG: acyl carrier protein [Candidatus Omnitrophica bacterium]|jgi:acyl carrier protein|nr:acyl carrier protein [Candidatus Omnitrophota bacterium]
MSDIQNTQEEIRQMVSEITEVPLDKLTLDADFFTDLNVDSLKAIEIVAAFEKKYRIVIPEQDIPKIRNVKQIVEYTKINK